MRRWASVSGGMFLDFGEYEMWGDTRGGLVVGLSVSPCDARQERYAHNLKFLTAQKVLRTPPSHRLVL